MDSITIANFVLAVVLPLVVGFVTKETESDALKSILLAGLTAAAVVIKQFIDAGGLGFDWAEAGQTFVILWVTAVASYYGLTKPTGLAGVVQSKLGRKDVSLAA